MGKGDDDLKLGRRMASTVPVRVPADTYAYVKAVGGMTQRSPGTLLAEAWQEYIERHREEFERDFAMIGQLIREGNTEGLVAFMEQGAEAEAAAMMRAVGLAQ